MKRTMRIRALGTLLPVAVSVGACTTKDPSSDAASDTALGAVAAPTSEAGGAPPPATASPTAAAPTVDQNAIAALGRMGTFLRSIKTFQVKARTTRDEVLTDGQKVQFASESDMLVRMPDRLRAEVSSDHKRRLLFYDGKSFTLVAPAVNYYATTPAPANVGQLIDQLEEKFAIEVPLQDLFHWGTQRARTSDITSARDLGPSEVDGVTTQHYAFRQEGLDWEIWIQNGDYPLPRKLVLTTMTDEARPQYTAVVSWNLAPSFNDAAFTFVPPPEAKKIVFADITAPSRDLQP